MEPRWWYLHSKWSLIMLSIRTIPIILGGIVVIVGLNVALAIRDSRMWDKIEKQQQIANTTLLRSSNEQI